MCCSSPKVQHPTGVLYILSMERTIVKLSSLITIRSPHAANMKQRSKKHAHKNDRRAKDSKKSWRNEQY